VSAPRAFLLIRHEPHYRREAFAAGLAALGYRIEGQPRGPIQRTDVLVIWNRYGRNHALACQFERAGAPVIVAENGLLGRDWRGDHWYALFRGAPAGGGWHPDYGPERWQGFGVNLCDWRKVGREIIVLAQRGIGPPGVAQPHRWHVEAAKRCAAVGPVRIREHPGERTCVPLETDLANAAVVVTWASAAALKALLWGIPVVYGFHAWIGKTAATPLDHWLRGGLLTAAMPDRLATFARVGSAIFTTREISTGDPFRRLLEPSSIEYGTNIAAA
jgi:hypothetical protein